MVSGSWEWVARTVVDEEEDGEQDEWEQDEWEQDGDGRSLRSVHLATVALPPITSLAAEAWASTLWRRAEAVRAGRPEVASDGEPRLEAADVSTCVRMVVDGWAFGNRLRLEEVLGPDGVVLFDWAMAFGGFMDLTTPRPFGRPRVAALVGDLWVAVVPALFAGMAFARQDLLRGACLLLHDVGDRHHAWCGLVQRNAWRVVGPLRETGAVTLADGVVTPTALGRYGIHAWVKERGGSAPVRMAGAGSTPLNRVSASCPGLARSP